MTLNDSAAYARECKTAKRNGQSKPPIPSTATNTTSLLQTHKAVITARNAVDVALMLIEDVDQLLYVQSTRDGSKEPYYDAIACIWKQLLTAETALSKIR